MKKAQLISEILGDCLLPLLGFLWWGWDLYFILLYLLFDYTIRIGFLVMSPATRSWQVLLRPLLFFFSFLILSHFYMTLTDPTWRFTKDFSAFFWYEELWIPQGFVLIPLLIYTEISRQRMEKMINPDSDPAKQVQKLGTRLLFLALIFMLMSLLLLAFAWSEPSEIWFFLSALLILILFENKAAFLQP
ncbi:MAG: hypothetical protein RLZZ357_595 [Bacteroidota bacterium]|jgi:hypothetical protein